MRIIRPPQVFTMSHFIYPGNGCYLGDQNGLKLPTQVGRKDFYYV